MSWFSGLFGNKKTTQGKGPKTEVIDTPDGRRTVRTEFELTGEPRPVRDDVVRALDDALESLGGEVMHYIDPTRILDFDQGGPPVWSVGIVEVSGDLPYKLLVTYGFSHVLSPVDYRDGIQHEYSIAVPWNIDPAPWADALLRHMSRYILSTGKDLKPGDAMPCYAPITYSPFPPEAHASMPATELVGLLVAEDPALGSVSTPHGDIEIRRLLGVHQAELDRAETWSASGFVEEFRERDPLLLTDAALSGAFRQAASPSDGRSPLSTRAGWATRIRIEQVTDRGFCGRAAARRATTRGRSIVPHSQWT